jgi:phage shock protein A
MGFFGKLWARIRGIFIQAGDDVVSSSPEAIRSTYAAAIDEAKRRYKEMERAVALLANEREKTEFALKSMETEKTEVQRKLEGALSASESNPGESSHREAGIRYLTRIKEIEEKQTTFAHDLDTQRGRVEEYKSRLRSFSDEIEKLRKEQGQMVAEFISNHQLVQLEDRLRGLGESAVDASVVAIREKVAGLRAQAKIAAELRGTTAAGQDAEYEKIGAEKEAASRFDELLKSRATAKAGVPEKERDLG